VFGFLFSLVLGFAAFSLSIDASVSISTLIALLIWIGIGVLIPNTVGISLVGIQFGSLAGSILGLLSHPFKDIFIGLLVTLIATLGQYFLRFTRQSV
jgi:hypothetical protein